MPEPQRGRPLSALLMLPGGNQAAAAEPCGAPEGAAAHGAAHGGVRTGELFLRRHQRRAAQAADAARAVLQHRREGGHHRQGRLVNFSAENPSRALLSWPHLE